MESEVCGKLLAELPLDQTFTENQLQTHFGSSWSPELLGSGKFHFTEKDGMRYYSKKSSDTSEMRGEKGKDDDVKNSLTEETTLRQQDPNIQQTVQAEQSTDENPEIVENEEDPEVDVDEVENPTKVDLPQKTSFLLSPVTPADVNTKQHGEQTWGNVKEQPIDEESGTPSAERVELAVVDDAPSPASDIETAEVTDAKVSILSGTPAIASSTEASGSNPPTLAISRYPTDLHSPSQKLSTEPVSEELRKDPTADDEPTNLQQFQEPPQLNSSHSSGNEAPCGDEPVESQEPSDGDVEPEVTILRQHAFKEKPQSQKKYTEVVPEYQHPTQDQPTEQDKNTQYEKVEVRKPMEGQQKPAKDQARSEQQQPQQYSSNKNEVSKPKKVQPPAEVIDIPVYKVGERVVGTLGDFGTVAVSFGNNDYGVDFDDGSKYRVTQDQLSHLPANLEFPVGCCVIYEGKNNEDILGRVEKYFGKEVYGVKFENGRKYRVNGKLLQHAAPPELESLKEPKVEDVKEALAKRAIACQELRISKTTDVSTWNYHSVLAWLDRINMQQYRRHFEDERVAGRSLLTLTAHNLTTLGVKRKHQPHFLKKLDELREICEASTIPGSQGVILNFEKRPFDFEIEWYSSTLTVTEITKKLSDAGICRGMKIVSCNGILFLDQPFERMLDVLKKAKLPACVRFEKILVREEGKKKKKVTPRMDELEPCFFGEGPIYVIKRGWLTFAKREYKGKEPYWVKRWCVLRSDDLLRMYRKEDSKNYSASLSFHLTGKSSSQGPEQGYFVLVAPCGTKTYKFRFQREPYLKSWKTAFNEVYIVQHKRARHAPLPQGPSRIIESLIKKNELSALWRHPQNGKTALQLCMDMNKMDIILRYINNDQSLLRLTVEEGGVDLRILISKALSVANYTENKEDLKLHEDALTLIGTVYDRTPLSSWHEILPTPCAVIDNLVELLHEGTRQDKRSDEGYPPLHKKIVLSCEAVIATLAQPGALRPRENIYHALLRCFENRAISHLFEILLKTECSLQIPSEKSLLYRAINLPSCDVHPIRWNHMFETLVRKGAPVESLSYGDQADVQDKGIDALTKSISLLHIESIQIMLRLGTEIHPVHTNALFTLVTRPDVVIIDKQKFLETLETILIYGAELGRTEWSNMGSFVKAEGEDLKRVGERAAVASKARIDQILRCFHIYLGNDQKIMDVISGFIAQFNPPLFFKGLEQFLQVREKCLRQRFPKGVNRTEEYKKEDGCVVQ